MKKMNEWMELMELMVTFFPDTEPTIDRLGHQPMFLPSQISNTIYTYIYLDIITDR